MAHIVPDRTVETAPASGTAAFALAGAVTSPPCQEFDATMATGGTVFYFAYLASVGWEVGLGTFTAGSPGSLARTTIYKSSNSNNVVNFGASGSVTIVGGWPADVLAGDLDISTILTATRQIQLRKNIAAAPYNALAYNNIMINAGMEVSQFNGTTAVTILDSQVTYVVDGVAFFENGAAVWSGQQVTDAPAWYINSVKFTVSTQDASIAAGDRNEVIWYIEGTRVAKLAFGTASADSISIGLWVKASMTGTFPLAIRNAAAARSYVTTFTILAANTWEFKTFTIPGDTAGTWVNTASAAFIFTIGLGCGTTFQTAANAWAAGNFTSVSGCTNLVSTLSATFQVTGVTILPGTVAPSLFEPAAFLIRPYAEEIELCRRYFNRIAGGLNTYVCMFQVFSTANAVGVINYTRMRAVPTLLLSSAGHFIVWSAAAADQVLSALTLSNPTIDVSRVSITTVGTALAQGDATILRCGDASGFLDLDARL